jgi:hypothetical protein
MYQARKATETSIGWFSCGSWVIPSPDYWNPLSLQKICCNPSALLRKEIASEGTPSELCHPLPRIDGLNVSSSFASFNTLDLRNNNFVPKALIWLNASRIERTVIVTIIASVRIAHVYRILVRNSKGTKPLGWLSRNVRIILKLILKVHVWEGVYWIHVAQNMDQ